MATPSRDGDDLVITLSTSERVEALAVNPEIRIPVTAIREIEIIDDPIREVHGLSLRNLKVTGTYFPGKIAVGTFLDGSLKARLFAVAHGDQPRGVRIRLEGARYEQIILGLDDPETVKAFLSADVSE